MTHTRKTATIPVQHAGPVINQDKGQAVQLVQTAHLFRCATDWLIMHGQLYIANSGHCPAVQPAGRVYMGGGGGLGYPVVQSAGQLCIGVEFTCPGVQRTC